MVQLIEARKAHGFTQAKLAKELGVSRTTVTMWETGEHQPSHEMLVKLASLLNTSTDYLLGVDIKKEPTTVPGGGQAEKLAAALRGIGIDVDSLTDADVSRIAKLAKAAFDD